MVKKGSAVWKGGLKDGGGTVSTETGVLNNAPYGFKARFETGPGTNPEELIGAAHAGCFSMFLAAQLTKEGKPPTSINTSATVTLGDGPTVTKIELETVAVVPGVDQKLFDEKVAFSKANCPISKALASVPEVVIKATLKAG